MRALGDRPARMITTREIDSLLRMVAATGVSARAVNKTRNIVAAAFNYAMKESTFALAANPSLDADVRREAHRGVLYYYSLSAVEQIADGVRRASGGSVSSSRCGGQMSTCPARC